MLPKKKYEKRNTIIELHQGGCGDVISATPCIRATKRAFPDDELIILSTYSDVLKHNPNIDILIPLNDPDQVKDFYSEYVLTRNIRKFCKFFPYDHIYNTPVIGCKTLREFICNLYGFGNYFDNDLPDIYLTDYEKRKTAVFLEQDSKPIVLLHLETASPSEGGLNRWLCGGCGGRGIGPDGNRCQMCGGAGQVVMKQKTNALKDIDPSVVAPIVAKYKDKYNFLQIGLTGERLVEGAIDVLDLPLRDTIALFQHPQVKTAIVAESLFMHAAAALRKSIITIFQNTDPKFFGYDIHYNVWNSGGCDLWACNRPVGALLDFSAGYIDPKTREKILWFCKNQKCKFKDTEQLEKVFLEAVEGPPRADDGHNSLEVARKAPPPKKVNEPIDLQKAIEAATKKNSPDLKVVKNDDVAQPVQQPKNKQQKKRGRKPRSKNVKQSSPTEDTKK